MAKNYVVLPKDTEPKVFGIFTKEKAFYKTFFSLLGIISLQQLAALTVNLVDNIMLGRYTELALAGANLVNQVQFMLQQLISLIGVGVVVLSSQYWGQKRTEPIKKIFSLGLKFGFAGGIIFFLVTFFLPSQVLGIFTNDTSVIAEGVRYLRIMCWTYLIYSFSNVLMYSLQAVESAMIGTVMSISTIIVNFCLNYCLIYGHFGAPELGIRGAAFATLTSRTIELIIVMVYILFVDKKLQMKLRDLLQFNFEYLKDFVKVSTPVIASGVLWGIAQAAQTAVLGHMSKAVIAANSIATVVYMLIVVFGFSCVNVTSIMMGKTIGEGRLHMVKPFTKTMQALFIMIGLATGLVLFLIKDWVVDFYTVSAEAKRLTTQFLMVLSITSLGTCYEFPVESGIIAGGGSTKYAPIVDNIHMWCWTIPSACITAFVLHCSPLIVYWVLKVDQLMKCIPNAITVNRYHWVKILTRDDPDPPDSH